MATAPYPPGYLEQYIGYRLKSVGIAFIPINTFFFLMRFLSRHLNKTPMGMDDWFIIPSLFWCLVVCASGIGFNSSSVAFVDYAGVGHHAAAVQLSDPGKLIVWAKFLIEIPVAYVISATFPKLAICSIYLRIFVDKSYRIATWIVFGILILSCAIDVFVGIFECLPVAKFWDKSIAGGHCGINTNRYFQWISMPNIITDAVMLLLPLPVIWKLHTSRNNKVGLTLTFLTGSVGLVTSILRFHDFINSDAENDGTWTSVSLVTWTIIEPSMYHIAACLPACRPLIMFLRKKLPTKFGVSSSSQEEVCRNAAYELSELTDKNGNVKPKSNGFTRLADKRAGDFGDSSTEKIVPVEYFAHENNGLGHEHAASDWVVESVSSPTHKVLHDGGDGIHVQRDYHVSSTDRPRMMNTE